MLRPTEAHPEAQATRGSRSPSVPPAGEALLVAIARRERLIVATGIVIVAALAWAYLLTGAGMDMPMDMRMEWTPAYALTVFAMWWVMMAAMMLPSAAPMILLYAAVNRRQRERGDPYVPTALFVAGYLIAWGGFSLLATVIQAVLERTALLTPAMQSASGWLGGGLLIAAGIYQLTPLKQACLRHCRGPLDFITRHWRRGHRGALTMGLNHGAYCLGCCWVVMGLLFYGGVMSLGWIVGLSALVLGEKLLPAGPRLVSISGIGFLLWGGWILLG